MSLNYILRAKKFKAKKSLGQNFLIDENIISFIANHANKEDEILEIGPGLGFVTEQLVENAKRVVALEIDKDAINILNKNLGNKENFHLIEQDILKTDIDSLPFKAEKIKVIANIPYYITSPILVHLLGEIDELTHKNRSRISEIVLMVQLEVAKRIIADEKSENKEYGQDSALVKFTINNEPKVEITKLLKRTVKAIFMARRKNVKNSLLNAGFVNVEQALEKAGIDKNQRGEKLSLPQIQALSIALEEFN